MRYKELKKSEQLEELKNLQAEYDKLKKEGLKLNMARGKPGTLQLDMVSDINDGLLSTDSYLSDGIDVRNYGEVLGIPAARKLFADILDCQPSQVFVGGNASLQLMFDLISKAYTHGLKNSDTKWGKLDTIKWICPVPGYDRHFKISVSFGMECINVPMLPTGPDMDMVEQLIQDPSVKGMWNVPKYSNPDGIVYSEETIERIASMKPAAKDFALMWDNAYCVHEFEGDYVPFPDIISLCRKYGNQDMVYEFASTSKITFPGAGISCMACSEENLSYLEKIINIQTIGYDKVNQLRHVKYLKNKETTLQLMKKHAEIMGPKFAAVLKMLDEEIAPLGIADYQHPKGGYFISVNVLPGCAKRTLELCKEAGVVMTGAGATYPRGEDPNDSNIRVAPSLPPIEELVEAMKVLCISIKIAALEKMLSA